MDDPTFTADNRLPRRIYDAQVERASGDLARRVRSQRPDVVAVHSARQLTDALGDVAVGLAGHTHRFDLRHEAGTVVVENGSAGAKGGGTPAEAEGRPNKTQQLEFDVDRRGAKERG